GLRRGAVYESVDELRYGRVVVFADQDDDGVHIRGLITNFIYSQWPGLINLLSWDNSHFLGLFNSLVTYTMRRGKVVDRFYSNPHVQSWYAAQTKETLKGLTMKYLKGIGSHKPEDEGLYYDDMKIVDLVYDGDDDYYMTLGFADGQSNWRKEWITRDMQKPG